MNVSRYIDTVELKFDVEFVTPCFLGGADGDAEIRVAPFKNLLRRWWRIANGNLSPEELWKKESRLFGSTEKDPDIVEENKRLPKEKRKPEIFGKSRVELKIYDATKCNIVNITDNPQIRFPDETISHPEVDKPMGFETYLGMGPVFGKEYKKNYIYENSRISLSLKMPNLKDDVFYILKTLTLINLFGSIGSRSRNGWGSVLIKGISINNKNAALLPLDRIYGDMQDWRQAFANDETREYPFYLGKDKNGILCWESIEDFSHWSDAMHFLADAYMHVRTHFKFSEKNRLEKRHLLGYPVTHHNVKDWERLPSQLLLKVIKINPRKYKAQIFHLPSAIPLGWDKVSAGSGQLGIWKEVHEFLDSYSDSNGGKNLIRFGGTAK